MLSLLLFPCCWLLETCRSQHESGSAYSFKLLVLMVQCEQMIREKLNWQSCDSPADHRSWLLLSGSCSVFLPSCLNLFFFFLAVLSCTVKLVWQCRTTLRPGQNKEQSIMEVWSCRGSFDGRLHPERTAPEEQGVNIFFFSRQAVKGLNVIHEDSGFILGRSDDRAME